MVKIKKGLSEYIDLTKNEHKKESTERVDDDIELPVQQHERKQPHQNKSLSHVKPKQIRKK